MRTSLDNDGWIDDSGNFDPEKFYKKHPRLSWLILTSTDGSDRELGPFNILSYAQKSQYKNYIYRTHLDGIARMPIDHYDYAESYQKFYNHIRSESDPEIYVANSHPYFTRSALQILIEGPPRSLEHFSFVMMSALVYFKRQGADFINDPFYETGRLINSIPAAAQLKSFYIDLRARVQNPENTWEKDCVQLFTQQGLLNWVNAQIKVLDKKMKNPTANAKNEKPNGGGSPLDAMLKRKLDITDHSEAIAEEAQAKLGQLIGLQEVKSHIKGYVSQVLYERARRNVTGHEAERDFRNMIFMGPPGVGKTTVAKYLGEVLSAYGVLPEKQSIVIPASDLIGGFVGQTEMLVRQLVNEGRGGLIVIDEFDIMAKSSGSTFDTRAIDTLNGLVDKEREHGTVFVLTGYKKEVGELLDKNAGLSRRFPHRIAFDHYTDHELQDIFKSVCNRRGYEIAEDVLSDFGSVVSAALCALGDKFGNASTVETIVGLMEISRSRRFDDVLLSHIANGGSIPEYLLKEFTRLDADDIPQFDTQNGIFKLSESGLPFRQQSGQHDMDINSPALT